MNTQISVVIFTSVFLVGLLATQVQAVTLDDTLPMLRQSYSWQSVSALADVRPQQNSHLSLLKWNNSQQNPPPPPEEYNRLTHFGSWLSIKDDRSCLDVRNRVLIRDSRKEVDLKPDNPCKILAGYWEDPYAGEVLTAPQDVDVDHMVPLKNAYINGAWKWSHDARCLYANYMGYEPHLKSVKKRENILKSDKDPSQYMPPNKAYRCQYLKDWLSIKLIWKLSLRVEEAQAIQQLIQQEHCDPDQFVLSAQELREQRKRIQNLVPICAFRNPEQQPAHP